MRLREVHPFIKGEAADVVLLDADPSVDINNTIKIARVMRPGQWLP